MPTLPPVDRTFQLLLLCFFLSGFAALLYQTAWTRELAFVFGTSELAVAAVLAAYMGGLALGAALAARLAARIARPVLAYGLLELAIALSALAVPRRSRPSHRALRRAARRQPGAARAGRPRRRALLQLAGAFAVLLPPTAFMGATLPLLARHAVRSERQLGPRVGVLYAVNTAGAIGRDALCAAFWLIPELGLRRTVWVGRRARTARCSRSPRSRARRPLPPDADCRARSAARSRGRLDPAAIALSGVGLVRLRGALDAAARSRARRQPARVRDDARELPARHRARQRARRARRRPRASARASASRSRSSGSR